MTRARSESTAPAVKGDVVVGTGTNTSAVLAVGTDGQVLTAASGQTTGLQWATPTSGGMTLLSTTNLSGTSTTISSISQSYINLMVVVQNPYLNGSTSIYIKPNSLSNIGYGGYIANGVAGQWSSSNISGLINANTSTTPATGNLYLYINNYTDSTYAKNFIHSTQSANTQQTFGGGVFGITSAITSIQIATANGTNTFSGGQVLIYGVK